jgi:hypothetical protein
MTDGNYALFNYAELATVEVLNPWTTYNMTGENITHRMQAFRTLKLVSLCFRG